MSRPLAIVTGASSGIGLELAVICGREGFGLLIATLTPVGIRAGRHRQLADAGFRGKPRG